MLWGVNKHYCLDGFFYSENENNNAYEFNIWLMGKYYCDYFYYMIFQTIIKLLGNESLSLQLSISILIY